MATALMSEEIYGDYAIRFPDVAVSINKTRFIFKCQNKKCKHVWEKEYRKVYQAMGYTEWSKAAHKPYRVESAYEYQRIEGGKVIRYESDSSCPKCGHHGESNKAVGTYSDHNVMLAVGARKMEPVSAHAGVKITGSIIYGYREFVRGEEPIYSSIESDIE